MLRTAASLGLFEIALPGVVLQELVDHRRRDLLELASIQRKADRLHEQLDEAPAAFWSRPRPGAAQTASAVDEQCEAYAGRIRTWLLGIGSVLDDPDVAHSDLVDRLLAGRRPFSAGETGYRDALIWCSTLESAERAPVYLFSANTKDFGETGGETVSLAHDLQEDLVARGLDRDRVQLVTTAATLLRHTIPDWDLSGIESAWSALMCSTQGVEMLDEYADGHLGCDLENPPTALPRFLWGVGVRSVMAVHGVRDVQALPEDDGSYRIHSTVSCAGRLGGYAWAWGDPAAPATDFSVWDDWGGLTEYLARSSTDEFELTVAAQFRPPLEAGQLEVTAARVPGPTTATGSDALVRLSRDLGALLVMLQAHEENESFQSDVLGDSADEFELIVAGLLRRWNDVADDVPGRYTALSPDNVSNVVDSAAGLRALRRDLEGAVARLNALLTTGDGAAGMSPS
jgi:hypothetical protein